MSCHWRNNQGSSSADASFVFVEFGYLTLLLTMLIPFIHGFLFVCQLTRYSLLRVAVLELQKKVVKLLVSSKPPV